MATTPDVYIEIARMESTQAYRDDPTIIRPPLEMIERKAKNLRGLWTGLQVEDQHTLYMIVAWDTVEDHHAFMADKEYWAKCNQAYSPSAKFDISVRDNLFHIPFKSDPYVHLCKPVSEFTIVKVKSGPKAEEMEAILRQEAAKREEIVNEGASRGKFTWGNPREAAEVYVLLTGWDSLEDSNNFRQKNASHLDKFSAILNDVGGGSTARYQLTKFEY